MTVAMFFSKTNLKHHKEQLELQNYLSQQISAWKMVKALSCSFWIILSQIHSVNSATSSNLHVPPTASSVKNVLTVMTIIVLGSITVSVVKIMESFTFSYFSSSLT